MATAIRLKFVSSSDTISPMDSHYHQVMKAREAVTETKPKLYFAYSTILDRDAFEEWRNEHSYQFFDLPKGRIAEATDTDLTFDFLSRWWSGRVAGLVNRKGSSVFGVLFEIPAKDWPVVQHKEGFITNMCVERPIQVQVDGQTLTAIAFTTNPQRATNQGNISKDFLAALVQGAEKSGLPKAYVDRLRTLKSE